MGGNKTPSTVQEKSQACCFQASYQVSQPRKLSDKSTQRKITKIEKQILSVQEMIKCVHSQIDSTFEPDEKEEFQKDLRDKMRDKLLLDTLKTMADLVMFTVDEERTELMTKFEKIIEEMMLEEDDMKEECQVAKKMETESELDMGKLRLKDGMLASPTLSPNYRKKTKLMPVSYKDYFQKYTYSSRHEFSALCPPDLNQIEKSTEMQIAPVIDVGLLEPASDSPIYLCKKDFGSSRIITKLIEKISELRRFNDFVAKESDTLGAKQRMNLNTYRNALQQNIEKFNVDKINYLKRNNYVDTAQRTAQKYRYQEVMLPNGQDCLIDEMSFATFHIVRGSAGTDNIMNQSIQGSIHLMLNERSEEVKESNYQSNPQLLTVGETNHCQRERANSKNTSYSHAGSVGSGDRFYAIKCINVAGNWFTNQMDGEKLMGRYLVERIDTFIEKDEQEMDLLYVVVDLYMQGDLETFIQKNWQVLCVETIIEWTSHLLIGAYNLCSYGIYSTDIRPATIRVDENNCILKLQDFGSSTKQRKDAHVSPQSLFQKIEVADGIADTSGKTDVYKIGCIAAYLFIWLDMVKRCKETQKLGEQKRAGFKNENCEEPQVNMGDSAEEGRENTKVTISDISEIYDHQFFDYLRQSKYSDILDLIEEDTKDDLNRTGVTPGSDSFDKQKISSIPPPMRQILKKMLRPRADSRLSAIEALEEIFKSFENFKTNDKVEELNRIETELNQLKQKYNIVANGNQG